MRDITYNSIMTTTHRKTRRRFENVGQLRFLTFSCYQRLPLFNHDPIKDAFVEQMRKTRIDRPFQLIAWVIMPEHVHLLIQPDLPDHPVSALFKHMKGCYANKVLKRWRQLNAPILQRLTDARGKLHFWQQGGGYDRNLYSAHQVQQKVDYIHENPVHRQLVSRAVDWKWSSARWYAGSDDDCNLPITPVEL
jgi:putative transposase